MILLLLLTVPLVSVYGIGTNPNPLGCERVYGDWNYQNFQRPMQIGDEITFNGTVNYGAVMSQAINIVAANGDIVIHIREDMPSPKVIYDNWIAAQDLWVRQEFGGQLFIPGQPFQIKLQYTGSTFEIFSGNYHAYSFVLRTPSSYQLVSSKSIGMQVVNWTELKCINPPVTAAPAITTTRRRGDGGNGGGGGHGGHHHGKGGYKGGGGRFDSDSSSGSSEFCDE